MQITTTQQILAKYNKTIKKIRNIEVEIASQPETKNTKLLAIVKLRSGVIQTKGVDSAKRIMISCHAGHLFFSTPRKIVTHNDWCPYCK